MTRLDRVLACGLVGGCALAVVFVLAFASAATVLDEDET